MGRCVLNYLHCVIIYLLKMQVSVSDAFRRTPAVRESDPAPLKGGHGADICVVTMWSVLTHSLEREVAGEQMDSR